MAEPGPSAGARMTLEWVTCPRCSTTFRVAVPSHYGELDVELSLKDIEEFDYEGHQPVPCVSTTCRKIFYLGLR